MTSEKAWPCQEGKRKTGVRKDGVHRGGRAGRGTNEWVRRENRRNWEGWSL